MTTHDDLPSKTRRGTISIPGRLRELDRKEDFAVLATGEGDQPYTSLISFALTPDVSGLIFATPRDTQKYRNIRRQAKVAILIDNRSRKARALMEREAVTIIGVARPLRKGRTRDGMMAVFLEKHPELAAFVESSSTVLMEVEVRRCIHVGQFQTISVWDCPTRRKERGGGREATETSR
jgi:heme iron utilization protein